MDIENPAPGTFIYKTQTHFDDLDALWVVYHAKYLSFLERAQQALYDTVLNKTKFDPQGDPDLYQVVRDISIRYRQSIKGVIPFAIALKVTRLRASGVTLAFEFWSIDGKTLYADGTRTACKLGGKTDAPEAWSEEFYTAYEKLLKDAKA